MQILNEDYALIGVERLHPHPQNANQGNLGVIAESVEVNGFYGAVTVRRHPELGDGQYQILAGEHRWRTAVNSGSNVVPCIIVAAEDDVHAARIMLVDNESAKRSTYDAAKLTDVLQSIGSVEGTGFDLAGLEGFERERAASEPPPEDEGSEGDFVREYGVVVVVESEKEQRELYDEFRQRGLSVRVASI